MILEEVANLTAETAKWGSVAGEDWAHEEAKSLLAECETIRGKARGLRFEYWVCRIAMKLGTKVQLKDSDKALYRKKQEFDTYKHDYCSYVWKALRDRAKPLLDRGLATVLTKTRKADKKAKKAERQKDEKEPPSDSD